MLMYFRLNGQGIEIDYTIVADPACTALTVRQDGTTRRFRAAEISTDHIGPGTIVSVSLEDPFDSGARRLGFFLPAVQVPMGQSIPVATIGATESFNGPVTGAHRPVDRQRFHLHGVAQAILAPPAAAAAIDKKYGEGTASQILRDQGIAMLRSKMVQ